MAWNKTLEAVYIDLKYIKKTWPELLPERTIEKNWNKRVIGDILYIRRYRVYNIKRYASRRACCFCGDPEDTVYVEPGIYICRKIYPMYCQIMSDPKMRAKFLKNARRRLPLSSGDRKKAAVAG